jgi:hypothetical protein
VVAHLEGICHVYADRDADLEQARAVVLNSKTRRTGICGAAECLLIDWQFYTKHGAVLIEDLLAAGVEVRTEGELLKIPGTTPAAPDDFGREFLDKIIAAKLVDGELNSIAPRRRRVAVYVSALHDGRPPLARHERRRALGGRRHTAALRHRRASQQLQPKRHRCACVRGRVVDPERDISRASSQPHMQRRRLRDCVPARPLPLQPRQLTKRAAAHAQSGGGRRRGCRWLL